VQERPTAGVHEKLVAPLAVSVVLFPAQMVLVPVTATVGVVLTVTVVVAESMQPSTEVPTTL
jgi:hypothetical protein